MPHRSESHGDDPLAGREPTSHERRAGRPWDASYHDGPAPWEIGGPQPAIVRAASEGRFTGRVLDAGCGSGENALYLAALGLPVLGFDVAGTALALARERAAERGLAAEFVAADALDLARLGRTFESVIDCGLFHSFEDDERSRYAANLALVTARGATATVLCFSDRGSEIGPHPIGRSDLEASFDTATGWVVVSIEPERVRTRFHDENGAPAWLAVFRRI